MSPRVPDAKARGAPIIEFFASARHGIVRVKEQDGVSSGRPSEEWGEDVVAFVVAKAGVKLERSELDHHCLEHIARFKRPKSYVFETELPKNNYGKVLKTELRARLAAKGNA